MIVISRAGGGRHRKRTLNKGVGESVFLMWTPGTWGEPMFAGGHFFSILVAGMVGGCPGWPISGGMVRTGGTGRWSTPGNEGRSGQEGQPPGSLGTKVRLTPAGEMVDQEEAGWHGSCWWGEGLATAGHRARPLFRHWGAIPLKFVGRITDSCRSGPRRCWEAGTRLCRTLRSGWAGAHSLWSPQCPELGRMGGGCGLPERIGGLH